jgi:hypothetical protein
MRLRDASRELLAAAETVGDANAPVAVPDGEWDADQILAHVCIVTAATIAATYEIASGTNTSFDNRIAQDSWTINRVIELTGGGAALRARVRSQIDVLCALGGPALSDAEWDTPVPTRLLSNGTLLVNQLVPLRELISGLADAELPGHTRQLLALLPHSGPG